MSGNTAASKTNKHYNKRTHIPVKGHKIEDLRNTRLEKLLEIATGLNIENPQELKRQDLMFEILKAQTTQGGFILFTGILEITTKLLMKEC